MPAAMVTAVTVVVVVVAAPLRQGLPSSQPPRIVAAALLGCSQASAPILTAALVEELRCCEVQIEVFLSYRVHCTSLGQ